MPCCTASQIAQSWRLTRSQNSLVSRGSKSGLAISYGSNRKWQTMSVRAGAARLQDEDRDVIAGETHEQVRVEELALVAHALVLIERRKRAAARACRRR